MFNFVNTCRYYDVICARILFFIIIFSSIFFSFYTFLSDDRFWLGAYHLYTNEQRFSNKKIFVWSSRVLSWCTRIPDNYKRAMRILYITKYMYEKNNKRKTRRGKISKKIQFWHAIYYRSFRGSFWARATGFQFKNVSRTRYNNKPII